MGTVCSRKRNNPEADLPDMQSADCRNLDKSAAPMSFQESVLTSEGYGGKLEDVQKSLTRKEINATTYSTVNNITTTGADTEKR